VAAGADGLIVEVHPNPDKAWSDGDQSLDFAEFDAMMDSLDPYIAMRPGKNQPVSQRFLEAVG
jgi:3-deoxy-7-phosphoheptulonate synthase